jgi:hypothetical protein
MSIQVKPDELAATLEKFPFVYLLTVGEEPRPHIAALPARVVGGVVEVTGAGGRSRSGVEANELVTLLAPPYEPGGYSLIMDGTARLAGNTVLVTPSRAVLHRPAPAQVHGGAEGCANDCVEVPVTSGS